MITALLLFAAAVPPLQPTTKWLLDYQPNRCVLTRRYGDRLLGISWAPLTRQFSVAEVDPSIKGTKARISKGFATMGEATHLPVEIVSTDAVGRGRMTEVGIPGDPVDLLARATLVQPVEGEDRASYAITNGAAAARAMKACQNNWVRTSGLDQSIIDNAISRAEPLASSEWLLPDDYPASELRARHEGTVFILWSVDEAGHLSDCRPLGSSGYEELDRATCAAIMRRGRYSAPARDAHGRAVKSYDARNVIWHLP